MKKASVIASIVALCCIFDIIAAQAADITGNWTMSVQTSAGSGSPTFALKQQGNQVSGTYNGQLGTAPVTGTVDGEKVSLTFKVSGGGQEAQIDYVGTVDGDKMSGTVKLGSLGEGTFTGSRK